MLNEKKKEEYEMSRRRSYSREFKIDCVKLSENTDKTVKEIYQRNWEFRIVFCQNGGQYI